MTLGLRMSSPERLIEVLSKRNDTLRVLLDSPKERHVLVDYLDDSKSTVYKGVSQLQEIGLIKSTPDGLQPTLFGVVALERYDELAQTADFRELLIDLPPGSIEPDALIGAEVVLPDNTAVDRHLVRLEEMLQNGESIRGFSPAISPDYVSILHQRVVNDDLTAEFILPTEILIEFRKEYPTIGDDLLSAENATLYRTEDKLPFTLLVVISDGEPIVGIEMGDNGLAVGIIINDTPQCLQWAEATYEHHHRTAERITE